MKTTTTPYRPSQFLRTIIFLTGNEFQWMLLAFTMWLLYLRWTTPLRQHSILWFLIPTFLAILMFLIQVAIGMYIGWRMDQDA